MGCRMSLTADEGALGISNRQKMTTRPALIPPAITKEIARVRVIASHTKKSTSVPRSVMY